MVEGFESGNTQGFALFMLSLCVILHTMSLCSGNNLEVL